MNWITELKNKNMPSLLEACAREQEVLFAIVHWAEVTATQVSGVRVVLVSETEVEVCTNIRVCVYVDAETNC